MEQTGDRRRLNTCTNLNVKVMSESELKKVPRLCRTTTSRYYQLQLSIWTFIAELSSLGQSLRPNFKGYGNRITTSSCTTLLGAFGGRDLPQRRSGVS